jgi:hypothetical protein
MVYRPLPRMMSAAPTAAMLEAARRIPEAQELHDIALRNIGSAMFEAEAELREDGPDVQTMATLMRQMMGHVPKDKQLYGKVMDYLKRHDLQGSPLRTAAGIGERRLTEDEARTMSKALTGSMTFEDEPTLYLVSYQHILASRQGGHEMKSALFQCHGEVSAEDILLWRAALGGKTIVSFQKLASSPSVGSHTARKFSQDGRAVTYYPL